MPSKPRITSFCWNFCGGRRGPHAAAALRQTTSEREQDAFHSVMRERRLYHLDDGRAGARGGRRRAARRPGDQRRVADAGAAAETIDVIERGRRRRARRAARSTRSIAEDDGIADDRRRDAVAASTVRRRRRPRACRRSSPRCRTRTPLPIVDRRRAADEPRSGEPARACARRTGASAKQQLDAAAAAVFLQDYLDRASMKKFCWSSCCSSWSARRGAALVVLRASTSRTAGYSGAGAVRGDPAGHRQHRRSASAWSRPASSATR